MEKEKVPCCLCGMMTKVLKPYPIDEQLCDDCVKEVQGILANDFI